MNHPTIHEIQKLSSIFASSLFNKHQHLFYYLKVSLLIKAKESFINVTLETTVHMLFKKNIYVMTRKKNYKSK